MTACKHCGGTGIEPDQKTIAKDMKIIRLSLQLTLAQMAKRLNISTSFLHDLETGRRAWSIERVKEVEKMTDVITSGLPRSAR